MSTERHFDAIVVRTFPGSAMVPKYLVGQNDWQSAPTDAALEAAE